MLRARIFPGKQDAGLSLIKARAILLDIEGTTTPIAFVHETLFPFARRHLATWLDANADSAAVREVTWLLRAEHANDRERGNTPPAWSGTNSSDERASVAAYAAWLMDRDRKSPGLKLMQGLIWEDGYRAGQLRGDVFDDVPAAIRRWHEAGLIVAIYSSGSELAQRRLFESIPQGDLTPLLSGFFDTRVGAKIESSSYTEIARALRCAPGDVLFISDVVAEVAAAQQAGLQVVLSKRPGNPPQPPLAGVPSVSSFDELA